MKNRVVLITGAASGMGKIAARELAMQGARLLLIDREDAQGRETVEELIAQTGNANIDFVHTDMSSFSQVRSLADHVHRHFPELHVLINNAGITDPEYRLSDEGHEQHLATHQLGHFLLTRLLLDKLKASAPSRVIFIASEAHKAGKGVDFADMNCEKVWKGKLFSNNGAFVAYHRAKLMMVCTTYQLARQLEGTGVTVNVVSPGYFVKTDIYRHVRGIFRLGVKLIGPFMADPEKSASTYVFLASDPSVEAVSGKYWEYCKEKASSDDSYDENLQQQVWEFSSRATGLPV